MIRRRADLRLRGKNGIFAKPAFPALRPPSPGRFRGRTLKRLKINGRNEKRYRNGQCPDGYSDQPENRRSPRAVHAAPRQHESGRQRPATPNRRIRSRHAAHAVARRIGIEYDPGHGPHGRPYRLCRQSGRGHDGRLLRAGPRQPRHRTPYPARKRAVGPLRLARLGRRRADDVHFSRRRRSRCGATN